MTGNSFWLIQAQITCWVTADPKWACHSVLLSGIWHARHELSMLSDEANRRSVKEFIAMKTLGIFTSWEAVWHAKVNILIPLVNSVLVILPNREQCYDMADVKRTVLFLHWLYFENTVHVAQFIGSKRCYLPMRQINRSQNRQTSMFICSKFFSQKASKCHL